MTLTRPWAVDTAFPNAVDQRKQLAGVYPREGLLPDPITLATAGVAYAGTGWGVNARAFNAVLKRGGAPYSQVYGSALEGNDGVVTGAWTLTGAPASGNRVDLLCIRARDTTQGDSATGAPMDGPGGVQRAGLPEFMLVTGPAGGATPAIPTGYTRVATVTTPSGAGSIAGSTIVNNYAFAQVVGSTIYARTIAERNALTNVLDGDVCYVLATGASYQYLATAPTPGWYHLGGEPEVGAIALGGLWQNVAGTDPAAMRRHGGLIIGVGSMQNNSSASVAAGSEYLIATISDATMRPQNTVHFATGTQSNATAGVVRITPAGEIYWRANAAASWGTGTLRIDLGGIIYSTKGIV